MSYQRFQSRRRDFDITLTTNTYAGQLALPYMSAAISAGDTIANNWVRVLDGIQYKAVIPTLGFVDAGLLHAATCNYTDAATINSVDRTITLTDLQVNETLCRKTLFTSWHGATGSRHGSDMSSPAFKAFVLATVAAKAGEALESQIWQGATGAVTGFLGADGAVGADTDIAAGTAAGATTVAITAPTATTAIAEIAKVYNKAAESKPAVLAKPDVAIYVSPKNYALYLQNLATVGTSNGYNSQVTNQNFAAVTYLGVPVHRCPGMPDKCIVLSYADNMVVGTNNGTDQSEVSFIPAYQYDGSDNIKVVMRMAVGTQTATATDVIIGKTF